jgi:hypothetical protein
VDIDIIVASWSPETHLKYPHCDASFSNSGWSATVTNLWKTPYFWASQPFYFFNMAVSVVESPTAPYYRCNCRIPGKTRILSYMSRRAERRHFLALPMYMVGYDAQGTYFREAVCTLDLCAQGARISNVHQNLKVGAELILEYKKHRIRFRVVWLGRPGTPSQGQAGLQAMGSMREIGDLKDLFTGDYIDTWRGPKAEKATGVEAQKPALPVAG